MIVRERDFGYLLIKQHDHGWVSGEFAAHWREKFHPWSRTELAIRYHDAGWDVLDKNIRWNPNTGRPFSFVDYPLEEKLPAYRQGIDRVEAKDTFAACLCSMHYASFFRDAREEESIRFLKREERRRKRLRSTFSERDRECLADGLRLLKLCDDLSLFVCLNEPGRNDHPWYRNGFRYGEQTLFPVWRERNRLGIHPNPFDGDFEVEIPYLLIDSDGEEMERDRYRIRISGSD
ncbi:DUF3891 family protein [Paludifilum halophilum]|nr:DUF3891 family protein [Paludifilum halophilum]